MSIDNPSIDSLAPALRLNLDIDFDLPLVSQSIHRDATLIEVKEELIGTPADLLSTLPPELISYIFCLACKPFRGSREWQRDCHPFHLGQLSKQYRQHAWASSELWATVIIRVVVRKVATQTELLEEWLARTSGRPIDIYFEIKEHLPAPWDAIMFLDRSRGDFTQPTTVPMINLLAKHSVQWRCIEFHIPSNWYPVFASSAKSDTIVADNSEVTEPDSTEAPLPLPLLKSASLYPTDLLTLKHLNLALAPSLQVFIALLLSNVARLLCQRRFYADYKPDT